MTTERLRWNTCVGRLISGSLTEQTKTDNTSGTPVALAPEDYTYDIGLAVRKDSPDLPRMMTELIGFVHGQYSRLQGGPQAWERANSVIQRGFPGGRGLGFSWKIKDGDAPNSKGEKNQHSAGCLVFYFSTKMPIKAADQSNKEIDPAMIKRGYFVDIAASVAVNGLVNESAGVYLNPQFVRFVAYGEEIIGGISAEQAFANAPPPAHLPPGASMTPLAPANGGPPSGSLPGMPPQTGAPAYGAPQTGAPQTGAPAYGAPQSGFTGHPSAGGYGNPVPPAYGAGQPQTGMAPGYAAPGNMPGIPASGQAPNIAHGVASPSNPGVPPMGFPQPGHAGAAVPGHDPQGGYAPPANSMTGYHSNGGVPPYPGFVQR